MHVVANFIQVFLDVLVHAMLEAPLDKRQLAHRRAMRRLGDVARGIRFRRFVEDVCAATKRIKEQAMLTLELVLLVQVGIHNGRPNLQQLGTALGKIRDGPIKGSQSRTFGAFVIQWNQRCLEAVFRLKVGLDNFLQKLAFTIRNAMLDLFMVFANFDGSFLKPKGAFHVDCFGTFCHLLKFLIFLKIILRFKFALANAPRTSTRWFRRAKLHWNVTWNNSIKLHFEKELIQTRTNDQRTQILYKS